MRDLLVIGGISLVAILIGAALFFLGPASLRSDVATAVQSAQTSSVPMVDFTVLEQGPNAVSITSRTNYRIQSSADMAALWPMVYGNATTPAMPTVDFTKYEVLGLFDGSHSNAGYSIDAQNISDEKGVRTVTIEHLSPVPTCKVSSSDTSPFVLLEVPKTTYSLSHVDVNGTNPCGN